MKKKIIYFILIILLLFPLSISAKDTDIVKFSDCIDGDTAKFILNNEEIRVRFLAIDTPETKHPTKGVEPYGKEASNYTCNKIKKAKEIILEYDSNSDKKDKYDRYLSWVFVDGNLLQDELISKGYAKVEYLYGDYKYTSKIQSSEKIAKKNKIGIWGEYKEKFNLETFVKNLDIKIKILITVIVIIIMLIYMTVDKKYRKKVINKSKSKIKSKIKKKMKNL